MLNVKFLWLGHFLHYHTTEVHHTWSTHWWWCVHVRRLCVTWPWPHFHSLLLLLNLHKVFMIRSVSPLPYNRGSPYLVHTLIMEGMCHLNLTSFSRSTDCQMSNFSAISFRHVAPLGHIILIPSQPVFALIP